MSENNALKSLDDMSHVLERNRTRTILCAEKYLNEVINQKIVFFEEEIKKLEQEHSDLNQALLENSIKKEKYLSEIIETNKEKKELMAELKMVI